MERWREKAHRIIARLSFAAWNEANPKGRNGQRPNRHRPYRVPELASRLVDCLNRNDEAGAKALFLSSEGLQAIR